MPCMIIASCQVMRYLYFLPMPFKKALITCLARRLGCSSLLTSLSLVIGDVSCFWSHALIADRSYVHPSCTAPFFIPIFLVLYALFQVVTSKQASRSSTMVPQWSVKGSCTDNQDSCLFLIAIVWLVPSVSLSYLPSCDVYDCAEYTIVSDLKFVFQI